MSLPSVPAQKFGVGERPARRHNLGMRMLMVVGALCACGDPRTAFVGHYKGVVTGTIFYSGGSDTSSDDTEFSLTAPEHSNRLQMDNKCMFTATVVDSDTIQFDPIACPATVGTSNAGATATYRFTYEAGTGTLTGKTLTIDQNATEFGSDYSDGSPNSQYDVRLHVVVTQQ